MMVQEYRLLTTFVQRVRHQLRLRRLLQSGLILLTVGLALLLLGVGVQSFLAVAPMVAVLYSASVLGVLGYLVYAVLLPALRAVSWRHALHAIETAYPALHDDLTHAVQLDPQLLTHDNPQGMALELVHALQQHTAQQIAVSTVSTVIRQRRLLGVPWCSLLVLTTALVAVLQPHLLGTALRMVVQPWSFLAIGALEIALTPDHVTIASGSNVVVQAHGMGRSVSTMALVVQRPGQADKRYPMEALGQGAFRYTFLRPQSSLTFYATAEGASSAVGSITVVPAPAIGHMALRYLFPDYTGLAERTQEGGGDIQALPGTQVHLSMQVNVPLAKGLLRLSSGREIPLSLHDQEARGTMLVLQEGNYVVELEDTHGIKNAPQPRYTVQVLPDITPKVTVRQPQDGLEVDETTSLQIVYEMEDDFGLQDAALVYASAGTEPQRIPLHRGRFPQRQVQDTFVWDMQQWPLPAAESIQFYLEVYDNDTISGPKKGVSNTVTLTVRSREREHQNLAQLQKDIAAALLDLLADHLDIAEHFRLWQEQAAAGTPTPSPDTLQQVQEQQQAAMERVDLIAQQLTKALDSVRNDVYSTYDTYANLQAVQRNLAHLQQVLLPQVQKSLLTITPTAPSAAQLQQPRQHLEAALQELERLSALAEQIAHNEKLHDLTQLSTKMLEQQNKLLSAFDTLKDFQGGEIPPEIQKMLDTLDAMMRDLMQAMAQLPMQMPDEFLNQQLGATQLAEMMRQLQEMREKLAAGDVEGARQLAEQLLKALSAMVAALQNMQQQARGGSMDAMGQQLLESANALDDLVKRQEKIVDETQEIDQEALRQLNEAQQKAFATLEQRLDRELQELSRLAWDLARQVRPQADMELPFQEAYQQLLRQLHALRKSLKDRDMPQVDAELTEAEQQLSWLQQRADRLAPADRGLPQQVQRALQHLNAARQALQNLPQDRHAMLTPPQRGQLGDLGQRQGGVQADTQALQQAFERLLPVMPFLPAEMGQHLRDALPFMGQAQGELHGQRSQSALPPAQAALEQLRQTQNNMQQAMQAMAQRGQMMGMPLPMLRQAGRLPFPDFIPQPQRDEQQEGTAGSSVRNFQLPDKEAYKVPRMFREDIMEALKEGFPERYKELIEQYYRNIIR